MTTPCRLALAAALSIHAAGATTAEETAACTGFAWPVVQERAAFAAPDLPALASGSTLSGGAGAVRLALMPAAEAALPIPSERARPGTYAGFLRATIAAAGTYQLTLSDDAWADVSQDDRATLKPAAISGKSGCPDVHKSLRFALDAGRATIEIVRAPGPQIKLGLRRVE